MENKKEKKPKRGRGRPKIKIDTELAEKLGALQCTMEECSAVLDIKKSTLSMRSDFLDAYKRGLEKGKMSIRRSQFKLAEKNAAMAIWLGKQYLGQVDKAEQELSGKVDTGFTLNIVPASKRVDEEE